jgi:hypothetical protein
MDPDPKLDLKFIKNHQKFSNLIIMTLTLRYRYHAVLKYRRTFDGRWRAPNKFLTANTFAEYLLWSSAYINQSTVISIQTSQREQGTN